MNASMLSSGASPSKVWAGHERLKVYQQGMQFASLRKTLLDDLPRRVAGQPCSPRNRWICPPPIPVRQTHPPWRRGATCSDESQSCSDNSQRRSGMTSRSTHFVAHFVAHVVVYASSHALSDLRPRRFEHGPAFRSMNNPPTNPEAPTGPARCAVPGNGCRAPEYLRPTAAKRPCRCPDARGRQRCAQCRASLRMRSVRDRCQATSFQTPGNCGCVKFEVQMKR